MIFAISAYHTIVKYLNKQPFFLDCPVQGLEGSCHITEPLAAVCFCHLRETGGRRPPMAAVSDPRNQTFSPHVTMASTEK